MKIQQQRKALFIGVNEYADNQIRNLRCSIRDAHSMNDIFEEIGYETRCLEDPGQGDVFRAVGEMTAGLRSGDQFLFYFAGHGFTDFGQHLLFCADDRHEHLRFHRAGIPFNLLEQETRKGGYDRAFLLDACQSDFLAGTRGEDATTRDLMAIGDMVPSVEDAPGSFYVLRSCSKYEHALEIESRSHGLFTLAMIDVLRQSRRSGTELLFNDVLRETIKEKMYGIALAAGMTARQTPESDGHGTLQVLINGRKIQQRPLPIIPRSGVAARIALPGGGEMEMLWCGPGEFVMGSPENEEGRRDEEKQRRVRLTKGFWLGKSPVTQRQWQCVMGNNPSQFKGDDRPVECVSWLDCMEFIRRVNVGKGYGVRLPTEAEWEYACRAGTETPFSWGSALNGDRANCDGRFPYGAARGGAYAGGTTPVGQYGANPWGFFDMHGNVWEWCSDWYGSKCGNEDPAGPACGTARIRRGGSWFNGASDCRSAFCDYSDPSDKSNRTGFRLCCPAGVKVSEDVRNDS